MGENITKVGIGVMIFKEGKVLLGKRKSKLGENDYSFPGGHLEYMESFEECARRETKEESGIEIKNIRFLALANLREYAPRHYVQINLIADWESGEPEVLEKDKCEGWAWYELDKLPEPMFIPSMLAIESYKSGVIYKDALS